jgi:4-alpha-glucanotransferase
LPFSEPGIVNDYNWDSEEEKERMFLINWLTFAVMLIFCEHTEAAHLSEQEDEELITTVADAPRLLPSMQTIKELDRNTKFSLPSMRVSSISRSY